ncbi:MAG TPA: phenylacetate--CoA ligase family protein, partial [Planctomycetota bacterium]|nr:phenylacetate--CoA ligase family protein [Planctomycetota bacterium]
YACKAWRGLHILPPDLLVESLEPSEELVFTGGRNPFLPLVRYRTGDRARLDRAPCSCGDRAPRIVQLRRA